MHTLNHTLEQSLIEADGRYLNSTELYPLEQYIRSYTTRLETYQQLGKHSEKLVIQALRKFAQAYPELIRQHGGSCKYDMSEVLRYIALSILRDDELFFKEQMMLWFDTIMRAYKKTNHYTTAYRYLQKAVDATLPPACICMWSDAPAFWRCTR
ncbi:MAG: phycobilisome protein [Hormoscilla sp. SP5CHS1]|nr:phycobilisome protein [Hormoscilla sp. SP12CHS1]MBC6456243.1 phycobilisome protein [Hormoscilla sp. SP5CHS1]